MLSKWQTSEIIVEKCHLVSELDYRLHFNFESVVNDRN